MLDVVSGVVETRLERLGAGVEFGLDHGADARLGREAAKRDFDARITRDKNDLVTRRALDLDHRLAGLRAGRELELGAGRAGTQFLSLRGDLDAQAAHQNLLPIRQLDMPAVGGELRGPAGRLVSGWLGGCLGRE